MTAVDEIFCLFLFVFFFLGGGGGGGGGGGRGRQFFHVTNTFLIYKKNLDHCPPKASAIHKHHYHFINKSMKVCLSCSHVCLSNPYKPSLLFVGTDLDQTSVVTNQGLHCLLTECSIKNLIK